MKVAARNWNGAFTHWSEASLQVVVWCSYLHIFRDIVSRLLLPLLLLLLLLLL